jgi:hypothetical protein
MADKVTWQGNSPERTALREALNDIGGLEEFKAPRLLSELFG